MPWQLTGKRPETVGRPRKYQNNAERQRAYRRRKKARIS